MMPLTLAGVGEQNTVKRVAGKPEVKKHLENLGFVVGSDVTVLNSIGENVIVKVKEARIAISAEMAQKYMYEEQKEMKTLRDVKIGETVAVKKLHGEGAIKRRIMDMGITKSAEIYVRKVAPLGDPIELTVRGYELSLRKADAEMIEVE